MTEQPLLLLVDDDTVALQVLSKALANYARMRFAKSGAEALRAIARERPDLVLLDANMPGLSGREVLKAIGGLPGCSGLPVIMVTSDSDPKAEAELLDMGASDFISKPFDALQLLSRVRVQLSHARLRGVVQQAAPKGLRPGSQVLLVDDDPAAIEALKAALAPMECQLLTAADGAEALAQLQELTPDLVLLDVEMPGLDGFAVCQAMQADPLLAQVPVAFVSVHAGAQVEAQSFAAGAADYLSKPFKPEVLRARVRNLLRVRQQRTEAVEAAATHWQALGESRVADLVAISSDAVVSLDAQGRVQLINQAGARLFGVRPDRVLEQPASAVLPGWEALELLIGSAEQANSLRRAGQPSQPVRLYGGNGEAQVVEPVVIRQGAGDQVLTTYLLRDAADRVSAEVRRETHRSAVVAAGAQLALLQALTANTPSPGSDDAILAMLHGQLTLPAYAPELHEFNLGVALQAALQRHAEGAAAWRPSLAQPHRTLIVVGHAEQFTNGLVRLLKGFDDLPTQRATLDIAVGVGEFVTLRIELNGRCVAAGWRERPDVMLALTELRAGGAVAQPGEPRVSAQSSCLTLRLLRPLVED